MQIGRPRRLPIYHWRNGYKIGRPATKIDGISDGTRAYHTELNYWFYWIYSTQCDCRFPQPAKSTA